MVDATVTHVDFLGATNSTFDKVDWYISCGPKDVNGDRTLRVRYRQRHNTAGFGCDVSADVSPNTVTSLLGPIPTFFPMTHLTNPNPSTTRAGLYPRGSSYQKTCKGTDGGGGFIYTIPVVQHFCTGVSNCTIVLRRAIVQDAVNNVSDIWGVYALNYSAVGSVFSKSLSITIPTFTSTTLSKNWTNNCSTLEAQVTP
jgi:hypothetical protein